MQRLLGVKLESFRADEFNEPEEEFVIDKFVLENADGWKCSMGVMIKVLSHGVVDFRVCELLFSFVHEYFGEILTSYLNSEMIFLEGKGHSSVSRKNSQFMIINWF